MEMERNEKVLAIYRAVWKLIDEGNDISRVKVADITAKAGIGKGTAYEYFRSKEEIVAKALRYDFLTQFQALEDSVENQKDLHSAIESCFQWLEENAGHRGLSMQFLQKTGCLPGILEEVCDGKEGDTRLSVIKRILGYMVKLGKEEGTIDPDIPDCMAGLQIFSQLVGFFAFQEFSKFTKLGETGRTKKFLYDNIVKSLRAT